MRRILFVDDEPKVLQGLERMLHGQRKQWEMAFVGSGAEALKLLETRTFDALVTDVRMPEMGGVQLLEAVQERYPAVMRVVLSGFFEREAALRAAGLAHQYLAKPCDPETLCEALERLCRLGPVFPDEVTRRVVALVGKLPGPTPVCAALLEALAQPDVRLEEIGRILRQDSAMSTRVLDLLNGPGFGLFCEMSRLYAGAGSLELETLGHLAVAVEIIRTFQPPQALASFSSGELQRHSRQVARIAAAIAPAQAGAAEAVTAALLHDAGKLVLASRLPRRFEQAVEVAQEEHRPLHAVERVLFQTDHAEVGGFLLSLWGLSRTIVDAVARHHHPAAAGRGGLDALAVTHIADALEHEQAAGEEAAAGLWDREFLGARGVEDQLPGWRLRARIADGGYETDLVR